MKPHASTDFSKAGGTDLIFIWIPFFHHGYLRLSGPTFMQQMSMDVNELPKHKIFPWLVLTFWKSGGTDLKITIL